MSGGLSVNARWALGLACGASALCAGLYVARSRQPVDAESAPSGSAAAAPSAPASGAPFPHRRPPPAPPAQWPFADPSRSPKVVPFQSRHAQEEQRIRELPPEQRRAERARRALEGASGASPYPPDCRPAAEAVQRVLPRYVAPTVRPLAPAPMELGHALLRATQDRNHLLPGEAALLTLEVAVDGKRVPFEVRGAELRQPSDAPGGRPESLASVPFLDDGVTPDAAAKDGIATARVSVPARRKSFDGKLQVRADVTTASEGGEVVFDMAATSAPPAIFTGVVRETIENGSLAFYAGIRVAVAGRYDFVGRVYDSQNRAMALLTANGSLDTSAREVRLNLCGQLLREANIAGPWELRDIEGLRFAEVTGDIERIPMPTWNGPHRTQVYPLEKFAGPASKKSEPQAP